MAVGDIVNFLANAVTSYVPAAGVEIIITNTFINQSTTEMGLSNGVIKAVHYSNNATGTYGSIPAKNYGITNTNYFWMSPSTTSKGFSGIQTK